LRDELSTQLKTVQTNLGGLASTAATVGKVLGVGLSVGTVVAFGREILRDADALVKLHDKTALSIGALVELRRVSIDSGSSVEGMASAINTLQRNIGNEDTGAVGAAKRLGLNFDALKRMSPEDQFFAVASALRGVTNQTEFVTLGAKLMGRGFAEVAPAIKQGFKDIDESAAETIKALDAVGDAIGRIYQKAKDFGGEGIALSFNMAASAIEQLNKGMAIALTLFGDKVIIGAPEQASALAAAEAQAAKTLNVVDASLRNVVDSTVAQSNAERVLGEQTQKLAEAEEVLVTIYNNKIRLLETATDASLKHYGFGGQIAALSQLDAAEKAHSLAILASINDEKTRAAVIENTSARHVELMNQIAAVQEQQAGVVNAAIMREATAQIELNRLWGEDAEGNILRQLSALELLQEKMRALDATNGTWVSTAKQKALLEKQFINALDAEASATQDAYFATLKKNAEDAKIPALMANAAAAVQFYNFVLGSGPAAPSSNLRPDTQSAIQAGPSGGSAWNLPGGGYFNPGNSAGVPKLAAGGPVSAGRPYLVGERGPELFMPSSSGSIRPGGGAGTTNIYITQPLGTPTEIARVVSRALQDLSRSYGERMPPGA